MKLTRKHFLMALLGVPVVGAAGAGYMRYLEPHWIEVTEKKAKIGRLKAPIRVLHLSDFHASDVVSYDYIEGAIDEALALKPELILVTGDFITWQLLDEARYRGILSKLAKCAPTFACIGNHDGGLWAGSSHGYDTFDEVAKLLDASGIRLLFNACEVVEIGDQEVEIVGLGDMWSGDLKPASVLSTKRDADRPVLVLSHNPDSKEELIDYDWDLMLCGHTHGGQLVIPLLGWRPFLPVRDKAFAEGLLPYRGRLIHVTRGVGNLHGMRFNCRPEISLLEVT